MLQLLQVLWDLRLSIQKKLDSDSFDADLCRPAPLGEVDGRGTGVWDLRQLLRPGDGLHLLPGPGVQVRRKLPYLDMCYYLVHILLLIFYLITSPGTKSGHQWAAQIC